MRDLQELPRFSDRLSFLYLEHARIEQHEKSVAVFDLDGCTPIPAADLAVLLLGPGTSISHAAICNLADCNCVVVWCGEQGVRFYSCGRGGTYLSANLLKQARIWANQRTRRIVVRRMYERRFAEKLDLGLTLEQVRGREGQRVRRTYEQAAAKFGLTWKGRSYDPHSWTRGDPLNRGLSAGSACLNGLATAAVVSAGYSTALGFIHSGKALSFVYDLADLFKIDLIVPLAFAVVAESDQDVERRVRLACRNHFAQFRVMDKLLPAIEELFDGLDDSGESAGEPSGGPEPVDDGAEGRDLPWPHDRESA